MQLTNMEQESQKANTEIDFLKSNPQFEMAEKSQELSESNDQEGQASSNAIENAKQFLTFFMRGQVFGASILDVREIIEFGKITKVPRTPAYIAGVINLRGSVVPVFDLAELFHIGHIEPTAKTCIIVLDLVIDSEIEVIGVLVDTVDEVIDLPESGIELPPELGAKVNPEYLIGVGKSLDNFILLLDLQKIFSLDTIGFKS